MKPVLRTVQLTTKGNIGVGQMEPAPAPTEVRTWRTPDGWLAISLWELGKHRIGEGVLHQRDGRWYGTCSEYAGDWEVSGEVGSGVLEFRDL